MTTQPIMKTNFMILIFQYFIASHPLYNRLRDDFKLPSVRTLSTLISKVSKLDDYNFLVMYLIKSLKIRKKI